MSSLRLPLIVFAIGFLVLFALRLGYSYWQSPDSAGVIRQIGRVAGSWDFGKNIKNYASFKRKSTISGTQAAGGGQGGGQKYEKVANIGLRSEEFEKEEQRIRRLIGEKDALIQFEQRQGLKGTRTLRLAVGVDPKDFDTFVEKVQTFGELTRLTINKSDKTNEYRDLQAKRRALEKTREALTALKTRDGEMRALIELEQQILSLEQQIQALGVNLGDFDAENEFVTVKLLLSEARRVLLKGKSFFFHAFEALTWTLFYYPLLWIGIAACLVSAFVGVHLLRLFIGLVRSLDAKLAKS
ncbi:MAG: DUF4349 domain-containing protein [Alphaproteobacteria bacterium]|nr:DUF4349 domain-containing protein [Alphaproteobacteria bacterium]